jgi:hypothetical protein
MPQTFPLRWIIRRRRGRGGYYTSEWINMTLTKHLLPMVIAMQWLLYDDAVRSNGVLLVSEGAVCLDGPEWLDGGKPRTSPSSR